MLSSSSTSASAEASGEPLQGHTFLVVLCTEVSLILGVPNQRF